MMVLVTFILSFLGIVLYSVSKISFVLLLDEKSEISLSQWYLSAVLILIMPDAIAFMRAIWRSSFLVNNDETRWPSKKSFLIGIICSLFEMASLGLFTLEVAPEIPSFIILPTLNTTLIIPFLMNELLKKRGIIVLSQRKVVKSSNIWCVMSITLCVLSLCLSIVISCILGIFKISSIRVAVLLPLCIFILSVVWYRQRKLFMNQYGSIKVQNNLLLTQIVTRIVVCISLPMIIMAFDSNITLSEATTELINGLLSLTRVEIFYIAIVNCSSTLICFIMSRLSAYYTTTRSGILLPSIISTVLSTVFLVTGCFYPDFIPILITVSCQKENIYLILLGIVVLIWLIPFLIGGKNHFTPSDIFFKPEKESFTSDTYNSAFFDQHLTIHYNPDKSTSQGALNDSQRTRVFICSTMYRESEYEMRQLLRSLHKVSISSLLKKSNVYLESHIFIDNGADGACLKEFAIQCLSVIESIVDEEQNGGKIFRTPYGIQLAYILPGGMSLFVHLKDPNSVKSKKRWSQVMYFEYILKYRIKETYLTRWPNSIWNISDHTKIPNINIDLNAKPKFGDISVVSNQSENILNANTLETSHPESFKTPFLEPVKSQSNISTNDSGIFDIMSKSSSSCMLSNSIADSIEDIEEIGFHGHLGESLMDEDLLYDHKTYVLCTDADMHFDERSVLDLVYTCNQDLNLGAACGRTYPMSQNNNPLVLFQKFEYARDFWMIKTAQNVIGTVMCCPGCFSLYRVKALVEVMPMYSEATTKAFEVFTKNTGEDRWMCTLMMLSGWKLRYSSSGTNSTFCPETFEEFIKQRRRWILSDIANNMVVFFNIFSLMRNNSCFTLLYTLYLIQQFCITVSSPTATILMLAIGLKYFLDISLLITSTIFATLCMLYGVMCVYLSSKNQIFLTKLYMFVFGAWTCGVITGCMVFLIRDIVFEALYHTNNLEEYHYLLLSLIASLFCAALLHPKESHILLLGVVYTFFYPATTVILPIYALCNIVDQTWGTRDNQKAKLSKIFCFPKLKRKNKRRKDKTDYATDKVIPNELFTDMSSDERRFWEDLVVKVVGKDAAQDLNQSELVPSLRKLRTHVLVVVLVINIILLTVTSYLLQNGSLSQYATVNIILYGFPFFIQLIGMIVFKFKEMIHKIGRICFSEKPVWVTTS